MVAYAKKKTYITPQEYLKWERKAETRSEYYDGVIVAKAGASWEHNLITGNMQGEFHAQLRGKPSVAVSQDLRVYVPVYNRYCYPDVVVVCGEPWFEDSNLDTLLNPTLIVEVLSESTWRTDRVEKYDGYTTLESLSTYVLVAQDRPRAECYNRQPDGLLAAHGGERPGGCPDAEDNRLRHPARRRLCARGVQAAAGDSRRQRSGKGNRKQVNSQ
jgi:Uma2 family endonuclease